MDFQKYLGLDDSSNYKQELEAHEPLMHLVLVSGIECCGKGVCNLMSVNYSINLMLMSGIGDEVLNPLEKGIGALDVCTMENDILLCYSRSPFNKRFIIPGVRNAWQRDLCFMPPLEIVSTRKPFCAGW